MARRRCAGRRRVAALDRVGDCEDGAASVLAVGIALILQPGWANVAAAAVGAVIVLALVQLAERHQVVKALLPTLANHPGVGFLLVRSDRHGGVVLGAYGVEIPPARLDDDPGPLAPFGPGAADAIRRTHAFPHTSAGNIFHVGIAIGKLNGVMMPHTPIGRRKLIAHLFRSSLGTVWPKSCRPTVAA